MRPILLALAIAGSHSMPAAAQSQSDASRDGLVGPVRVVRAESVYAERTADGYKPTGSPRLLDTVTYDEAGNYREREVIDDYGFPVGKETFAYTGGRLTATRLVDPKGAVLVSRTYAYGGSSDYVAIAVTDRSGRVYEERYTRGVGGRIDQIRYVSERKDRGTTRFTYSSDPQKPDQIAFFMPGGRRATASVGPCLGAHRLVYRYVDGRVSEREIYEESGELKRRSLFKYDDHGSVAEEIRTEGPTKSSFQYEYLYDDRGNWIRRVETVRHDSGLTFEDGSPRLRVTTRVITYF